MPDGIPIPDGFDIAILKVESLLWDPHWRPDITAAGRFVAYHAISGDKITTIDAYLMTDHRVEMWEDDGPVSVDLAEGDYSGRPHPDWRDVVEPLFANALAKLLTAEKPS